MVLPCIILTLAWAMGEVCRDLGAGRFLASFLGHIDARFLPAMIFMISCLIAFALGNTFGTIAIVASVALPLLIKSTSETTLDAGEVAQIRAAALAAILSGAIWGNHMSLVSDTTIVAATGAGCDHLDHVHTQLPYAAFVGLTALVVGFLPAGFGLHPLISYAGIIVAVGIVIFVVCDKVQTNITTQANRVATAKIRVPKLES
jgi:Na+/H+ antiporter NhaC